MRSGVSLIADRKICVFEDGERDASGAKILREIDLDAAAFANNGFNWQQSLNRTVTLDRRAVAKLAIEPEGDNRHPARCRPCAAEGALGSAPGWDRVCQSGSITVERGPLKKNKN